MSGRGFRNLVLVAAAAGLGYWIYEKRPTLSGIVDSLTRPLLGSGPSMVTERPLILTTGMDDFSGPISL